MNIFRKQSLSDIETKAQAGDNGAQYELARFYLLHNNMREAYKWCLLSAENNNHAAQHTLGQMYFRNKTIKNDSEALNWYNRAANGGFILAYNSIAILYEKQSPPNIYEAARYLLIGATLGDCVAHYNLAFFYFFGRGVKTDYEKAYYWMSIAILYGLKKKGMNFFKMLFGYFVIRGKRRIIQDFIVREIIENHRLNKK